MPLERLKTYQFRNLDNVNLTFDSGFNVVFGNNASGKTSLLEAAHVICSGKSFLRASPQKLQQFNSSDFSLNGIMKFQEQPHRYQYLWKDHGVHLKINEQIVRKISRYALQQPVQAITPASFKLIDESPDIRRRFIDWGVFHVKHQYIDAWHRYQRSLSQRNAMLTQAKGKSLMPWDIEYVKTCEIIDAYRSEYITALQQSFENIHKRLLPDTKVTIAYHRGWAKDCNLGELLAQAQSRDIERGYTYYGPQRAELHILLNGHPARDTASRGQKKLITYGLYIAQAQIQQQHGEYSGLLLVDDLPSELDAEHQSLVLDLLTDLPMQVILSCIDPSDIEQVVNPSTKLFHVKQGKVEVVLQ